MFLQHLALQPFALPHREVRVLDRQLRQRRRFSVQESVVQGRHFLDQHVARPVVRNDVVCGEEHHVIPLVHPEKSDAQERRLVEREGPLGVLPGQRQGELLPLVRRNTGEVHHPDV